MAELESMVVRLMGDAVKYEAMMDQAVDTAAASAMKIEASATRMVQRVTQSMESAAAQMMSIGKRMSFAITAPIVGAGGLFIKMASDAEETASKFKQVYASVGAEAQAAADVLEKSFLMSRSEAQKNLAATGDLLTGWGFAEKAALRMSSQVTQLAADLASFSNVDTERAVEALTKGLLGEREAMKLLGIVVNEEMIKSEMAAMAKRGETFATVQQAKAQATLNLMYQQTVKAQGDISRTMDGFANQSKKLKNELKNVGETFGQILLPAAKDAITTLRGATSWVSTLTTTQQKWIVSLAGAAAAAGPLLYVLGALTKVASGATKALTALWAAQQAMVGVSLLAKLGLIGLAVGGVYLLTRYIYNAIPEVHRFNKHLDEMAKHNAGRLTQQLEHQSDVLQEMATRGDAAFNAKQIEEAASAVRGLNEQYEEAIGRVHQFEETSTLLTDIGGLFGTTDLEGAQQRVDQIKAQLDQAQSHFKAVQKQAAGPMRAGVEQGGMGGEADFLQAEAMKSVEELTTKLQEQIDTFGLSADAAALYTLAQQDGADAMIVELTAAQALANELAELEKQKKASAEAEQETKRLNDNVKTLTEDLATQAAMFDKTSREAAIYKLALKGATDEQLAAARASDLQLIGMEKLKKLSDEAKQLTEQHMSPAEKFTKVHADLTEMLNKELITLDVFNKALADARKEMAKDLKVNFKVSGVEAVEAGTNEAMIRLAAFRALSTPIEIPTRMGLQQLAKAGPGAAGPAGVGAPKFAEGGVKVNIPAQQKQETKKIEDLLTRIAVSNDKLVEKRAVVIEAANL